MNRKLTTTLITIIIFALIALGVWYFFFRGSSLNTTGDNGGNTSTGGFAPLDRTGNNGNNNGTGGTTSGGTNNGTNIPITNNNINNAPTTGKIPVLRLLSSTPVGGYGSITTSTTTTVRWIDRGRGNVSESKSNSLAIQTLSNTLLPRVYSSIWSADLNSFIGSVLLDDSDVPTTIYAQLISRAVPKIATKATVTTTKTATSTAKTSTTTPKTTVAAAPASVQNSPYDLRGSNLPAKTVSFALSPQKDRVFVLTHDGEGSIGYVSNFDGSKMSQIFETPMTQINIEWPTDNIIAVTNKGTSNLGGYLYFVNPRSGVWTKILGPINGLSTKVSHDGKYVLYSGTGSNNDVTLNILDVVKGTSADATIRTLADKCVWGNFYKDLAYCGVPFQPVSGTYPDDWYRGTLSTIDKIWQIKSGTGEIRLVAKLIGDADRVLNTFNLGLDDKDNFLFFMNKDDLSLWSLDLVKSK